MHIIRYSKFLFICAFIFSTEVYADNCTSAGTPVTLGSCSTAGEWGWDSTNLTYRYCNGTDWVSMESATTAGSCSGITASTLEYDGALTNYKFCNGTNWIEVTNNGASGTCTQLSEIEYDTTSDILKWCNGTNWIDVSLVSGGGVTGKCVFVTSTTRTGNLGGVSGADTFCQSAGSGLGGTYKAWLGESNPNDPQSDFTESATPYILVNGTIIANDWADLTDGTLAAPINIDETGTTRSGEVWSNVNTDGTTINTDDCNNWSSATNLYSGNWGNSYSTNSNWTNAFNDGVACGFPTARRLYCFEQ